MKNRKFLTSDSHYKFPFSNVHRGFLFSIFLFLSWSVLAQDKQANLKLSFEIKDSVKLCKVTVDTNNTPVKDVAVKFFAKRFYSLLPLGQAVSTDEHGVATLNFPTTLPGGANGMIIIIAKIEDNDNFANTQTQDSVKWGTILSSDERSWQARSLSASREKAPLILIIVSNAIIIGIWGTLFYIVLQLFRIKKAANKTS